MMRVARIGLHGLVLLAGIAGLAPGARGGDTTEREPALWVRLIHPERQAAAVLNLFAFEGSRASSPAAALTAWKRATGNPGVLGKPVEAVIAMANPEMVQEWRVLHDALVHVDVDPADGSLRWIAIIPRDDGTVAAAITAARLTYPDEAPLMADGRDIAVARLGRSGVPVAGQVGPVVMIASSRAELLRGMPLITAGPSARRGPDEEARAADTRRGGGLLRPSSAPPPDSGLVFRLTPGRIGILRGGSIELCRAVEAVHGLGCQRMDGFVAIQEGRLAVEVTSTFAAETANRRVAEGISAGIEPAWLDWLPESGLMAFVALAIDADPARWDRTFAWVDRVERVDPARAGVAPLRTRVNLLAAAAGIQPEVDLWPHLRGVSACLLGDPDQSGRPVGAVVMLHLDQEASAEHLVHRFAPRWGMPLPPSRTAGTEVSGTRAGSTPGGTAPRRLGTVLGREVAIWRRERSAIFAWGDPAVVVSHSRLRPGPRHSVAAALGDRAGEGRGMPHRIVGFWPGRLGLGRSWGGPGPVPSALRALLDDPPAVWWGWNSATQTHDSLRWPDLPRRVRRFLEAIPLDPPSP